MMLNVHSTMCRNSEPGRGRAGNSGTAQTPPRPSARRTDPHRRSRRPGCSRNLLGQGVDACQKHDSDNPYLIANELICCRLAAAVGLPVLGEVARDQDGATYWACSGCRLGRRNPVPPVSAHDIALAQMQVVAGMIVFDSWVNNTRRRADNVVCDERLGVWLVDHEYSLAQPHDRAFTEKPDDEALALLGWHEFADEAIDKDLLRFWEQRVRTLSAHVIGRPLLEANQRGLITQKQQSWLMVSAG